MKGSELHSHEIKAGAPVLKGIELPELGGDYHQLIRSGECFHTSRCEGFKTGRGLLSTDILKQVLISQVTQCCSRKASSGGSNE